ncbi:hypothetical protein Patl1_05938 [Pistacia atlantica]|uniref:Uncharacterized protein n=1 Tax=Pistacia atlantica TaxID=434234 RepID=A0ACC1BPB5_9ROSI|nr:hypothetical protein Patl1_05938 [Pistacia atlantica]
MEARRCCKRPYFHVERDFPDGLMDSLHRSKPQDSLVGFMDSPCPNNKPFMESPPHYSPPHYIKSPYSSNSTSFSMEFPSHYSPNSPSRFMKSPPLYTPNSPSRSMESSPLCTPNSTSHYSPESPSSSYTPTSPMCSHDVEEQRMDWPPRKTPKLTNNEADQEKIDDGGNQAEKGRLEKMKADNEAKIEAAMAELQA